MIYRYSVFIFLLFFSSIWFLYQIKANFFIDADEAITGLMALHINQGREIPIFYYGQHYIGPLEALLASFFFEIFGPSAQTLKLSPLIFFLLGGIVGYKAVTRDFGHKSGLIFLALFFIPGHFILEWSGKARGNFTFLIFAVMLLHWLNPVDPKKVISGFLCGLSWWMNPQISSFTLAFILVYFRRVVGFGFGFILGMLPVIIANINQAGGTAAQLIKPTYEQFLNHLDNLFRNFFPILLGFKRIYNENPNFFMFSIIFTVILIFQSLYSSFSSNSTKHEILKIHALNILIFIVLFSFSKFGSLSLEPRYGMVIYPSIIILTSFILRNLNTYLVILLIILFSYFRLATIFSDYKILPTGTTLISQNGRVPRDLLSVANQLIERGVTSVRSPYWLAYALAFLSGEKIKVDLVREPFTRRIEYFKHSDLTTVPVLDHQNTHSYYEDLAKLSNLNMEVDKIGDKLNLYSFSPKPLNFLINFKLQNNSANTQIEHLFDNSLDTVWHTGDFYKDFSPFTIFSTQRIKGIYLCTSRDLEDVPDSIILKQGDQEFNVKKEWLNFLKSSRCLAYLFDECLKGKIDFKIKMNPDRNYYFSLSEFKLVACE